jgi:hypothetical protein
MLSQNSSSVLLWCFLWVASSQAFLLLPHENQPLSTALFGRRINRKLDTIIDVDDVDGIAKTPAKKRTLKKRIQQKPLSKEAAIAKSKATAKAKKTAKADGNISPALTEWMATQKDKPKDETKQDDATTPEDDDDAYAVASYETFDSDDSEAEPTSKSKSKNARRVKQSVRQEQDEERAGKIDQAIDVLEEALEEAGNLPGILSAVQGLLTLPSGSLRMLLATQRRHNYRLAWVGSDDAVCHVGTGLHKVPLARLQEVFFNCLGKNRIEVLEVIRILGPFPNVKNTLQGKTTIQKNSESVDVLQVVMDSMVDGTGKEILAGNEENIRRVDLQVHFCDERAIVAVMPPADGSLQDDPLQDNGVNVLVFVREDQLDEKLDSLRVS